MNTLKGVTFDSNNVLHNYSVCLQAKQTHDSFHSSDILALNLFDLVCCDVWGPYREKAFCRSSYFLTIVDDYSCAIWVYLLLDKTEVPHLL